MFRQHLKCSLTAPRRAGTSYRFFCSFLLSQLSEPGRLGTALSGPASRLASAMTFSDCDTSPMVDYCSFSICQTQSPEELGSLGKRSLGWTDCRAATLTFFFFQCLRGEGEDLERGEKNSPLASQWLHPLRCMQKRDSVSVPRSASRKTDRPFQAQSVSHRTD